MATPSPSHPASRCKKSLLDRKERHAHVHLTLEIHAMCLNWHSIQLETGLKLDAPTGIKSCCLRTPSLSLPMCLRYDCSPVERCPGRRWDGISLIMVAQRLIMISFMLLSFLSRAPIRHWYHLAYDGSIFSSGASALSRLGCRHLVGSGLQCSHAYHHLPPRALYSVFTQKQRGVHLGFKECETWPSRIQLSFSMDLGRHAVNQLYNGLHLWLEWWLLVRRRCLYSSSDLCPHGQVSDTGLGQTRRYSC